MSDLAIIGRERALVDRLTKRLHDAAARHYDYGTIHATRRGNEFEVRMNVEDAKSGWIARVSVEFDRIEEVTS